MRLLRVLSVVAAIVAIILFILYGSNADPKDLAWGLAALAASVGLLALDPVAPLR